MLKRPAWPGIATSVGIILILTFVSILRDNDFHLKDWQTLFTGVFALIAATIAYWGATESVRHSQIMAERENDRRKLALYMKLEFAFRQLGESAQRSGKFIFMSVLGETTFRRSDFYVLEPPELEEAWQFLDLFPRTIIAEIRTVRNNLRLLTEIHNSVGPSDVIIVRQDEEAPPQVTEGGHLLDEIRTAALLVASELEPLIKEIAPPMDENERMHRFYGEPYIGEEDRD